MNAYKTITTGVLAIALSLGLVSVVEAQNQGKRPADIMRAQAEARLDAKQTPPEKKLGAPGQIKRDEATTTASTTGMFKKKPQALREEIKKKMEAKQFETRKAALVRELNKAVAGLTDIISRIESRITKAESEGRNMTEPKALLVTAKAKVEKAKTEVAAFAALTASSTPPTGTASTTEVDLTKPRQLGDAAIKSVKEARDALQKVVVSIAHNMGLGNKGKTATTTPPTTGTTTPPTTATTTATTTSSN